MIDYKNPIVVSSTQLQSTLANEVIRNVKIILSTTEGEVPCDRSFGLNPNFIDANLNMAQQLYTITAIDKVEEHEPRATVDKISFRSESLNGALKPEVVIKIEA